MDFPWFAYAGCLLFLHKGDPENDSRIGLPGHAHLPAFNCAAVSADTGAVEAEAAVGELEPAGCLA